MDAPRDKALKDLPVKVSKRDVFGRKQTVYRYESLDAFTKVACESKIYRKSTMIVESSNGAERVEKWSGAASLEDAADMARVGIDTHRESVDIKVSEVVSNIAQRVTSQPHAYFDVSGGEVDVARFLDPTTPECMREWVMRDSPQHGKVVRVLVPACFSSSVSAETIAQRGTAILALINAMAVANMTVEVWVEITLTANTHGTFAHLIKLSDAADPIDSDRLMYALTHASLLRRLGFACLETHSRASGYGLPTKPICAADIAADVVVGTVDVSNGQDWKGDGWITSVMRSVGVTFAD